MNTVSPTTEKLTTLLETPIADMGYDLLQVEVVNQGKETVLRLYISAPGGIQLDDCVSVSHHVSAILDVEDPLDKSVSGGYLLEVSSPGLDRPLIKPAHFRQFIGDRAKIVTSEYILGRRRFTGQMVAADESGVVLEVDGESYELPYDQIESARLNPLF